MFIYRRCLGAGELLLQTHRYFGEYLAFGVLDFQDFNVAASQKAYAKV